MKKTYSEQIKIQADKANRIIKESDAIIISIEKAEKELNAAEFNWDLMSNIIVYLNGTNKIKRVNQELTDINNELEKLKTLVNNESDISKLN